MCGCFSVCGCCIQGIIPRLIELLQPLQNVAFDPSLPIADMRLFSAALWALSNTVGSASGEDREDLLAKLPWLSLRPALCSTAHPGLQAFSWKLLQSLAHSSDFFAAPLQQRVVDWSGGEVLELIGEVVRGALQ
jgi:hypothetical protein